MWTEGQIISNFNIRGFYVLYCLFWDENLQLTHCDWWIFLDGKKSWAIHINCKLNHFPHFHSWMWALGIIPQEGNNEGDPPCLKMKYVYWVNFSFFNIAHCERASKKISVLVKVSCVSWKQPINDHPCNNQSATYFPCLT